MSGTDDSDENAKLDLLMNKEIARAAEEYRIADYEFRHAEWEYEKVYKRHNGGDIPEDWPITREEAQREFDFANKVVFEATLGRERAEGALFGAIHRTVGSADQELCERLGKRAVDLRVEAFEARMEAFCSTTRTDPGRGGNDLADTRHKGPSGRADAVEKSKAREDDADDDDDDLAAGLVKKSPFRFNG